MARIFKSVCRECGVACTSNKAGKFFCGTPCRQAFNNRRMQRGAELYDLFMSLRYERDLETDLDLRTAMSRMAQVMRQEDERERDGRKSWQNPNTVLADRLDLKVEVLQSARFTRKG
jgi:hypothetical protein